VSADPYAAEAPPLPATLRDAVDALDADQFYRSVFGATLVDYLVMMKRAEIRRYEDALASSAAASAASADSAGAAGSDVSEWEMREYFEFF
jgi:glutamine synthetase